MCLQYRLWLGKTHTAKLLIDALLTKNPNLSVLVSVPTDELQKQWQDMVIKNNLVKSVTVKIVNTIIKDEHIVDLLIIDEAHAVCSNMFSTIFKCVKYKLILCLTATLERLDGKEILIKKYAPVCDIITFNEAVNNGWLSPVREYKVLLNVDMIEYNKWNAEFLKSFATFNFDFNLAMKCSIGPKSYIYRLEYAKKLCAYPKEHKDYKATIHTINEELRAIAYSWSYAMRKRKEFVTKHPKKIEIAQKILDARPNAKAITFSHTIEEAEKIQRGYTFHSKHTKKKRGEIMEEFKACKKGVLNSSKAIDVGLDVPDVNLAIILSGNSSNIQKTQRVNAWF